VPNGEQLYVLGTNGILYAIRSSAGANSESEAAAPEPQRLPAGSGELSTGPDGTVAWFVPNAALTLQRPGGESRSLSEVVCAQPSSLVPAGGGRLVAACRSGQLWLIGPSAPTEKGESSEHGEGNRSIPDDPMR
jgi:hypothetical protein